jgi:hypothetical protein
MIVAFCDKEEVVTKLHQEPMCSLIVNKVLFKTEDSTPHQNGFIQTQSLSKLGQ